MRSGSVLGHPIITLTSHLQVQMDGPAQLPHQQFSVGEILRYIKENAPLLTNLPSSDRHILNMLADELKAN